MVSSDLDIDGLRQTLAQADLGDSVKIDGSGGRVTLSGTVATQAMADNAVKLAGLYSKEVADALTITPVHAKQVRLEVRILEVDHTKLLELGINLFNPGGNTNFLAQATTSQYPSSATYSPGSGGVLGTVTASNPLNFMLYAAKINLGATIQDLQNKQVLQILAEPTITTMSGVKADFLSGGEFPFPIVQPGGTGGAPVVTISFRPYGVKLEFTPVVNADRTITLTVAPEVSALDYSNSVSVGGFSIPALSTRRASTEVELRSNRTSPSPVCWTSARRTFSTRRRVWPAFPFSALSSSRRAPIIRPPSSLSWSRQPWLIRFRRTPFPISRSCRSQPSTSTRLTNRWARTTTPIPCLLR